MNLLSLGWKVFILARTWEEKQVMRTREAAPNIYINNPNFLYALWPFVHINNILGNWKKMVNFQGENIESLCY